MLLCNHVFSPFLCLKVRSPPHTGESCPQGSSCRLLSTSLRIWCLKPMGNLLPWKDLVSVEMSTMTSTARSACFFRCCFRQELLRHWNAHGNTSVSHCSLTNRKTGSKCPILDHWAQEPPDRFICRQQNLSKPDTDVTIWQQRCHFFTLSCSKAHRGFSIFIGFTTKHVPILLSTYQDYWNDDPPLSLLDLLLCSGRASELTAVQQAGFFIWLPLTSVVMAAMPPPAADLSYWCLKKFLIQALSHEI